MKKIFFALAALATLTFVSCEKKEVGGTEVQDMSGEWYVHVVGLDEDGSVLYEDEDLYGFGNFILLTYNDAANKGDKLFIQDTPNADGLLFWDFKVKTNCNTGDNTFSVKGGTDLNNSIDIDVTNGKILFGAAKTPSGQPADSITFDILFEDDPYAAPNADKPGFKAAYYDRLRITGYRYTGFVADN